VLEAARSSIPQRVSEPTAQRLLLAYQSLPAPFFGLFSQAQCPLLSLLLSILFDLVPKHQIIESSSWLPPNSTARRKGGRIHR
jgi:hypothetical protein